MTKPTFSYRGYQGSAEFSTEDHCLHGEVLFIDDLISYEAETDSALQQAFIDAVDRYLAYCETTHRPPDAPRNQGALLQVK